MHDLHDFIDQLASKMDAEYRRIRKSARRDPGTAGDEGEENWAELLRDWLPPAYQVVTKGQLLDDDGSLSPQVDVLVLKPTYPPALHHRKKYLAAGVAAAFECKLTLRKHHIMKAFQTAAIVKRMGIVREGTPYRELMSQPIFGLLAHSNAWSDSQGSQSVVARLDEAITEADSAHVKHPREMLDLICVSNLATWSASKQPLTDPEDELSSDPVENERIRGLPATAYMCHSGETFESGRFTIDKNFKPLGIFITELLSKLAWEDLALRGIVRYFIGVEFSAASGGKIRCWPRSIYSKALRRKLKLSSLSQDNGWGEWDSYIE